MKTNAEFRKLVCMVLTLAVGMTIGGAAMLSGVWAEGTAETAEERLIYQSSENYAISSDGSWDGGIWSAQVYDLEKNAYTRMTDASSGATWGVNYGTDEGDYYRLAVTNPDNYQRAGAYWMAPAARTKADGSHKNPAVKTFTAPKSGIVTVSCGDDRFGPKDGMQSNTRIRLESVDGTLNTIWPMEAEYFTMPKDSTANVPYDPFSISLKQGERLHFEVSRNAEKLDTDLVWAWVYWDPVVTYSDPAAARDTYLSSENFPATEESAAAAGPGTWDHGVWSAQIYDTENRVYQNIIKKPAVASGYNAEAQKSENIYAYIGNADNKGNSSGVVGAYTMRPTISLALTGKYAVAKTFTAPKSGDVKISCGQGKLGQSGGRKMNYRITLDKADGSGVEQIWPADGFYTLSSGGVTEARAYDPFTIKVQQGDRLHFEIAGDPENTADIWEIIYWDPQITYRQPAVRYRASDAFSTSINGDPYWRWQYYDVSDSAYRDLAAVNKTISGFYIDGDGGTGPAWIIPNYGSTPGAAGEGADPAGNSDVRSVAVGKYHMRSEVFPDAAMQNEKSGEIVRDYAVKLFTAPKRGVVKVYADGNIDAKGAIVRITRQRVNEDAPVQVWPKEGWEVISNSGEFKPISLSLNQGDILRFESGYRFSAIAPSPWGSIIRWDPVVEYTAGPYKEEITVTDSENHRLTAFSDIVSKDNATVTIPISGGTSGLSAVAIVGIYDSNDTLVRAVVGAKDTVGAGTEKNLIVDLGEKTGLAAGRIKIFLLDGLETLAPVSDIGSSVYIESEPAAVE